MSCGKLWIKSIPVSHTAAAQSSSQTPYWPTRWFSWIFPGACLQLKSLGPHITIYCKGVRSEAMRYPRSVAVQILLSRAVTFTGWLSPPSRVQLSLQRPSPLIYCTIRRYWTCRPHRDRVHLAFLARVCKWPIAVLSQLFVCIWPLTTTRDKRTPTRFVAGDAVTELKSQDQQMREQSAELNKSFFNFTSILKEIASEVFWHSLKDVK